MGFLSNGNGVITITFSDVVSLSNTKSWYVVIIKRWMKKAHAFGAPMPCGAGSSIDDIVSKHLYTKSLISVPDFQLSLSIFFMNFQYFSDL